MQLNECGSLIAQSPGCASVHAGQHAAGLPCCPYPTCAHQDLQVLFSRATSQSVSLQPLLLQEFLQLQEQDFAFVILELPKALAGPFRQPV